MGPGGSVGPTPSNPTVSIQVVVTPDPCGLIAYNARVSASLLRNNPAQLGAKYNG